MGYNTEELTIQASAQTSNHNSPKDERDKALWYAAVAEITYTLAILDLERRYKSINLTVTL
jgi:beta-glucanase (GH16 family)